VELYLHIGTEKTGTTSVQRFFGANRELLARQGILYPDTPGNRNHTKLAAAAQDPTEIGPLRKSLGIRTRESIQKLRAELIAGLKDEYASRDFKTVVMSGEHCSSRLLEDDEVQWLKDILTPYFDKVHVVVYLRRQDAYLLSIYSTTVKSGATFPLRLPPDHAIRNRYDYWPFLSRWARVFGRDAIICRKFERSALMNGDVVDDFLGVAGIAAGPQFERPEDINESLDASTLEFLRIFNRHVPRFVDDRINPAKANVINLLTEVSKGPLVTLSDEQLAEFMAIFEESNSKVAKEYFGGIRSGPGDPLFEPRSDKRDRTAPVPLTVERTVEIAAYLWQEKQAQIDRAIERARRHERVRPSRE
jgi:hypothetical protein